jgi:glycosyltransferase involved in cell wall biosynthesis
MKIGRICYEWPPPWDGLTPNPYEISKSQTQLGHKIVYFSANWPNSGKVVTENNILNIKVIREPLSGLVNITSSVLIFFKFKKWMKTHTVDVLHFHGHFGLWILRYLVFVKKFFKKSKLARIPIVYHFHNTVAGREDKLRKAGKSPTFISQFFAWPLAKYSDKLAVDHADALIACSNEVKNEIFEFYNPQNDNVYLVENGVNTNLFAPINIEELEKSRVELGFDNLDKIILFVGKLTERKNPDLLIEALAKLPPEYKLFMIGRGSPEYEADLKLLISKLGVKKRVIMSGYNPYPHMPVAYQISDLLVLPSDFEGLPKVALEALSSKTHVLASSFELQNEISGFYKLEKLTTDELVKKITEIFNSGVKVDRQSLIKHYSWEIKVKEIDAIYNKIISK